MSRLIRIADSSMEFGTPQFGPFEDSSGILEDSGALRNRLKEHGYLFIRGFHPRDEVLAVRQLILSEFHRAGVLLPGTLPSEGVAGSPSGINPWTRLKVSPEMRRLIEAKRVFELFERIFNKAALCLDLKIFRSAKTGDHTGAHYDAVYVGQGSANVHTLWMPFGDVPIEQGTLVINQGSHSLPGFARLRDTYGKMDVDRDRILGAKGSLPGWFSHDPVEILNRFGGRWVTDDFQAGDILIFGLHTMHISTTNTTNRYRLSVDARFQPSDEPADQRWSGAAPSGNVIAHGDKSKFVPLETARKGWGV